MAEFEEQLADVPDAFKEAPGVSVSPEFAAHIEAVFTHFVVDCMPQVLQAKALGYNTVSYRVGYGCTLAVQVLDDKVTVQYTIPPDVADQVDKMLGLQ
jgi:hypothetical protein